MSDEVELLESIDHKLKMLVTLAASERVEDLETNKAKVRELHSIGLGTNEIAELIQTTPASVRAAKSNLRQEGVIDE